MSNRVVDRLIAFMSIDDELYSISELAKAVGCSNSTVSNSLVEGLGIDFRELYIPSTNSRKYGMKDCKGWGKQLITKKWTELDLGESTNETLHTLAVPTDRCCEPDGPGQALARGAH